MEGRAKPGDALKAITTVMKSNQPKPRRWSSSYSSLSIQDLTSFSVVFIPNDLLLPTFVVEDGDALTTSSGRRASLDDVTSTKKTATASLSMTGTNHSGMEELLNRQGHVYRLCTTNAERTQLAETLVDALDSAARKFARGEEWKRKWKRVDRDHAVQVLMMRLQQRSLEIVTGTIARKEQKKTQHPTTTTTTPAKTHSDSNPSHILEPQGTDRTFSRFHDKPPIRCCSSIGTKFNLHHW